MKRYLSVILCLIMVVSLAGCTTGNTGESTTAASQNTSAADGTTTSNSDPVKIGFSFGQSVHPFFVAMQMGAEAAAEEAGAEIIVTTADYKVENQVANIEDLMQQDIQVLLVNPIDSAALSNIANEALDAGIGVFPVDINVDNCDVTGFVASDNVEIGRMAANYIIEQLGGTGKVAFIGNPSVTSLRDREEGFYEVMDAQTGIEVVANQAAAVERTTSLEAAETILQANPDLDAFFACNESSAMGSLSAATARGNTDLLIVGVDATDDNLSAIQSGSVFSAAIAQDPYMMGYLAVQNALKWVNNETTEAFISVPIGLITIENVDEYIEREANYKSN